MASEAKVRLIAETIGEERLRAFNNELKQIASTASNDNAFRNLAASASKLRSELDPMYAAQQRYNQAIETATLLHRQKIITDRELAAAQQLATEKLQAHTKALFSDNAAQQQAIRGDGQQRSSMIMLGQQIGDIGVQLQSGTSAARVFAMQAGQVGYALADMGGAAGRVGTFLAGPWGAALTIAVSALGLLAEKLLNTTENVKKLEFAEASLAAAQSAVGQMFDITTGKIKANTVEVRLNTLAKIENMRMEGIKARAEANKVFADAGEDSWRRTFSKMGAAFVLGQEGYDDTQVGARKFLSAPNQTAKRAQEIQTIFSMGRASSDPKSPLFVDKLFDEASKLNFKDINTDRTAFLTSLSKFAQAVGYERAVKDAQRGMADNQLPASLVTPKTGGRERSGPKAPTAEAIADAYATALNSITQEELKARRALTNTIEDRYQAELESIKSDMEQKRRDLANNDKLDDKQKEIISAKIATVEQQRNELAERKKAFELSSATNQALQTSLSLQRDEQGLMLDLSTTRKSRLAIQLELLRLETEQRRAALNNIINAPVGMVSDTERAKAQSERDQLDPLSQLRAAVIRDRNASPVEKYMNDLIDTAGKVEDAWANAMKGTEDALVNFVTTGKLSFASLANSIIADIARIAIQQAIMKPLTSWFNSIGLFAADGAVMQGGVKKFATGGVVTRPTLFPMANGGTGLMGEAGPEAIMPLKRLSNGKLGVHTAGGGGGSVVVNVNVEGGNSQVMGDAGKAAQLGNLIAGVVRNELVVQKRPGGLLAAA